MAQHKRHLGDALCVIAHALEIVDDVEHGDQVSKPRRISTSLQFAGHLIFQCVPAPVDLQVPTYDPVGES